MRDYLGISELGHCARRVFYAHDPSAVPEVSEETERVMQLGHLLEALRRRELKKAGTRVFGPQMEVAFGRAQGHVDGYLRTPEGPVLWEAKSTTGFSISKWRREGLPRRISWQVAGYGAGLSEKLGVEVHRALLETIDRTSGEVFSWTYDLDPEVTVAARERTEALADALASGSIPDREFEAGSSECRYCPYRSTCRPDLLPPDNGCEVHDAEGWAGFRDAVELYQAGQELKEEGEQLVARAKETLQTQLLEHGASRARVNGSTVLWGKVETARFDAKALQAELPDLYAEFLKPSTYSRLEVRR